MSSNGYPLKTRLRNDKNHYYLDIARSVAMRSTCLRRKYGAIIVKDDAIVSTGYNGSPRGEENCCDRGTCKREDLKVPHGERYELCDAVHAENNAVINAARNGVSVLGGTLYIYGYDCIEDRVINAYPCMMCARVIKNAGIAAVIISKEEKEECICGNCQQDSCGPCIQHCHEDEEHPEGKGCGKEACHTGADQVPEA